MIELAIIGRARDLGGFEVRRLLPSMQRRLVGPFVFFDHMGPSAIAPGAGFDVRPHPHVGLATLTYLFDGEIDHRDSLGTFQTIRPGDVNWMIAGRGIVHSERSGPDVRRKGMRLHGIQCWVALPRSYEETDPRFEHQPGSAIPAFERDGVSVSVIAGESFGLRSPVSVLSPTLYAHARFAAGGRLVLGAEHEERAVYVVEGALRVAGEAVAAGTLAIVQAGADIAMEAAEPTSAMLLGGARLDGTRFIEWNFVASTKERIERAKEDWRAARFPTIPGDDAERIELPRP